MGGEVEVQHTIVKRVELTAFFCLLKKVEHVKAHRTKKDKSEGRCDFGRRIYGGNESKDSPAGPKRGVCNLPVRRQFPLLVGRVERL